MCDNIRFLGKGFWGGVALKISRVVIQNYKSIKNIDIALSDKVNVFTGENSVGKAISSRQLNGFLGPFIHLSIISPKKITIGEMKTHM